MGTIEVDGCQTIWQGSYNITALLRMTRANGSPAFTLSTIANVVAVEGTVYNELVRPASWVQPALGVRSDVTATAVRVAAVPQVDVSVNRAWAHVGGHVFSNDNT